MRTIYITAIEKIVSRTVIYTKPITIKYELTEYGHSLKSIIEVIAAWGMKHRVKVIRELTSKSISLLITVF